MTDALVSPDPLKNRHGGWRPNSGRPRRDDWQDAFLTRLSLIGAKYRAALDVGVDFSTVRAELERSPAFAECFEEARNLYADRLEILLHRQGTGKVRGNPLPVFALLKKHRPQEYIERHAILNVDVHIDVPTDQARQVLGEMLAHVTPSTVERLSAEQLHRSDAPLVPSQSAVLPASGLILDVPALTVVQPDASSEGRERLNPEFSGIRAQSRDAKEADAAPSGSLALPPAELVAAPPIRPRKPLNTGRQA